MVGIDLDPARLLPRDRAFFVDRLKDAGNGGPREAEEKDTLTGLQLLARDLRRLEDGNGGFPRTGTAGDELMPNGLENCLLRFG